jgi:hypothetical protein
MRWQAGSRSPGREGLLQPGWTSAITISRNIRHGGNQGNPPMKRWGTQERAPGRDDIRRFDNCRAPPYWFRLRRPGGSACRTGGKSWPRSIIAWRSAGRPCRARWPRIVLRRQCLSGKNPSLSNRIASPPRKRGSRPPGDGAAGLDSRFRGNDEEGTPSLSEHRKFPDRLSHRRSWRAAPSHQPPPLELCPMSPYSYPWRCSPSRIRHPGPGGSGRATPPGKFQQTPAHPRQAAGC